MSASALTSRRALVALTLLLVALLVVWSALRSGSEAAPAPRAGAAQAGKVVFDSLPGSVRASLPVRSFDAGGVNDTTPGGGGGGGGGAGKFVPDDTALVLDAADVDPLLLRVVATGTHLQKVTVTLFRAGTSARQQVWEFADVTLSRMRTAQTGSARAPRVSLGLRYAEVTVTTYDARGGVEQSFCFAPVASASC